MKIIIPLTVTDAMLIAHNINETDHSAWSAAISYALGARVISPTTHKIYESLQGSNLNHALTDTDWWLEVSATNRWKMFDRKIADQSSNAGSIALTLSPGEIVNAVALFNVSADELTIVVTDSTDGEVYNRTIGLVDNSMIEDWYAYFFEPIARQYEVVLFDLPSYGTAEIDITLSVTSGNAAVGEIVIGRQKQFGHTLYGTSVGIVDYSRKERDTFGNAVIVERDYSQRVDFDLSLNTQHIREMQRTLSSIRAQPVVWSGTEDGEFGMLVYGYYRDFDIVIANYAFSDCTIQVEGLT
jgi:hypothetical protein